MPVFRFTYAEPKNDKGTEQIGDELAGRGLTHYRERYWLLAASSEVAQQKLSAIR